MIISVFLCLFLFVPFSDELNNGLGLTPQMGKRQQEFIRKKTPDIHIFFY